MVNQKLQIKVYAPTADSVRFIIYKNGLGGSPKLVHFGVKLNKVFGSVFFQKNGSSITIQFKTARKGVWGREVCDPYAKAIGANGDRAYLVTDIFKHKKSTSKPQKTSPYTDASIYELHLRDISIHASSGVKTRGHF